MDTKQLFGCLFSLVFTLLIDFGKAKWAPDKCSEVGFSSSLLCSSCDDLKQFNLGSLEEGCKNCCEAAKDDGEGYRHPKATLKVCQWKIGRYPQIKGKLIYILVRAVNVWVAIWNKKTEI